MAKSVCFFLLFGLISVNLAYQHQEPKQFEYLPKEHNAKHNILTHHPPINDNLIGSHQHKKDLEQHRSIKRHARSPQYNNNLDETIHHKPSYNDHANHELGASISNRPSHGKHSLHEHIETNPSYDQNSEDQRHGQQLFQERKIQDRRQY